MCLGEKNRHSSHLRFTHLRLTNKRVEQASTVSSQALLQEKFDLTGVCEEPGLW